MPRNVKCKNCNNLKNHWCEKVIDSPDEERIRDCQHFWQKTNGDHIRSMSDADLAAFLQSMIDGDTYCTNKPECGEMLNTEDGIPDEWCAQCLLNWLRKPAEVENNG